MTMLGQNTEPRAQISDVQQGSAAARAGVGSSWKLVSVNEKAIPDILAYRRELEHGKADIVCTSPDETQQIRFSVEWEDPGLDFDEVIFDGLKLCANKCEFCYVHQMPKGFRKSLYVMDDDFRTSFLYGSFVTLTNLSEADVQRIVDEQLSPLYVSVHTANQDLRADMMKWWRLKVKDEGATRIRGMLERLESIDLYTQMVLLPERNDGDYLDESLEYLASLDHVLAVAIVPVGLTDHRVNLPSLKPYNQAQAQDVLRRAHAFQKRMLKERATRFVFPSDEFYLLADTPLPSEEAYEGFQMLENGVGMVRDFLSSPFPPYPLKLQKTKRIILATGKLFAPILERAIAPLHHVEGLELEVRCLRNITFGEVTTVAGLLAGKDILAQITPGEADTLLLSPNVLKFGTELLLDDISTSDLERELAMRVAVGGSNLAELVSNIFADTIALQGPQFGFSTHALKEGVEAVHNP